MLFIIMFTFIIIQRMIELWIAKKNEKWMLRNGGVEYGENHYKIMVFIHILFFLSLLLEVIVFERILSELWPLLLSLFALLQIARIWVIFTLGKYWNTKIIVLPGATIVSKGPFRFLKHPNYIIVTLELLILPLMFNAYITAIVFFFLNQWILSIRIPLEEKALKENTDYTKYLEAKVRR